MSIRLKTDRAISIFREEGATGILGRIGRRAGERWGGYGERLPINLEDIADSATVPVWPQTPFADEGTRLEIGWVISAPGPASGGHTTLFRFIEALEKRGHRCTVFVYDATGGDVRMFEELIRTWWPGVRARIRLASDGLGDLDVYVANAWQTAHVVARHPNNRAARFYLVQDYEPNFYPWGDAHALAEDTYRFGFRSITVGAMLAHELHGRYGYSSVVAPFGSDLETYTLEDNGVRNGVVFYAKPGTPRRGYQLGVLALQRLNELRPDLEILTFGQRSGKLPFSAETHLHLTPRDLSALYNRCAAGLSLSFTNMSLIPFELLACGVVPVVNAMPGHELNLDNPHIVWARPTPDALAHGILEAVERRASTDPGALRASVAQMRWDEAQDAVVEAIEAACIRTPVLNG
jgi:hypothetical protein